MRQWRKNRLKVHKARYVGRIAMAMCCVRRPVVTAKSWDDVTCGKCLKRRGLSDSPLNSEVDKGA